MRNLHSGKNEKIDKKNNKYINDNNFDLLS
jgi:hypothetical protein